MASAAIAGLLSWTSPILAGDFSSLIRNSPFGGYEAPVAAPAPVNLEFRGLFVEQGKYYFSLYDVSSRRREWVTLNETGHPFTALSFDADDESLVVSYQGGTVRLKLMQAKILGITPALPANAQPVSPLEKFANSSDAPPPPILRRRALKSPRTIEQNRS